MTNDDFHLTKQARSVCGGNDGPFTTSHHKKQGVEDEQDGELDAMDRRRRYVGRLPREVGR
jgi:hypothetical protein